MFLLLSFYILISVADIFTTGRVLAGLGNTTLAFAAIQVALITAFFWTLALFGALGFQVIDDGTPLSLGLFIGSATLFLGSTLYVSLDTSFGFSTSFRPRASGDEQFNIALYILHLGLPLICGIAYAVTTTVAIVKLRLGGKMGKSTSIPPTTQMSSANRCLSPMSRSFPTFFCSISLRRRPDLSFFC
jgi:hypothetical protein